LNIPLHKILVGPIRMDYWTPCVTWELVWLIYIALVDGPNDVWTSRYRSDTVIVGDM
jgi:hypothetical protein